MNNMLLDSFLRVKSLKSLHFYTIKALMDEILPIPETSSRQFIFVTVKSILFHFKG